MYADERGFSRRKTKAPRGIVEWDLSKCSQLEVRVNHANMVGELIVLRQRVRLAASLESRYSWNDYLPDQIHLSLIR